VCTGGGVGSVEDGVGDAGVVAGVGVGGVDAQEGGAGRPVGRRQGGVAADGEARPPVVDVGHADADHGVAGLTAPIVDGHGDLVRLARLAVQRPLRRHLAFNVP